MRALLVDDDPSLRMLLRRLLVREFNVECLEADNGVGALEVLRENPVDLVALDLRMPLMGGIDVLAALRRSPEYHNLPVVIMTTMDDDDVVRRAVALGISDYLLKPFNSAIVQLRLNHLLQSGHLRRQRRPVKITADSTVLVVDGDMPCSTMLAELFGEHCNVHVARDGIDGFKHAIQQPSYAALVLGHDLGLLDRPLLMARLREEPKTRFLPVIGLGVSDEEVDEFDAVMPRTFVPELARAAVAGLIGANTSPRAQLRTGGALDHAIRHSTTQATGLLTQIELQPVTSANVTSTHRWLIASVELTATHFSLDVQLVTPMSDARALVASRDARDLHAVGEEQAVSLLEDLVSVVANRLSAVLESGGHIVDAGEIRCRSLSNTGGWPAPTDRTGLFVVFQSPDGSITLGARLHCWSGTHQQPARPQ
jgi:two-component system chemotaxis response regulator CheY